MSTGGTGWYLLTGETCLDGSIPEWLAEGNSQRLSGDAESVAEIKREAEAGGTKAEFKLYEFVKEVSL